MVIYCYSAVLTFSLAVWNAESNSIATVSRSTCSIQCGRLDSCGRSSASVPNICSISEGASWSFGNLQLAIVWRNVELDFDIVAGFELHDEQTLLWENAGAIGAVLPSRCHACVLRSPKVSPHFWQLPLFSWHIFRWRSKSYLDTTCRFGHTRVVCGGFRTMRGMLAWREEPGVLKGEMVKERI